MSRRRTRPPRNRKSQARDSEAPQPQLVPTLPPPAVDAADAAEEGALIARAGDELAALDAGWDEV
jgi:hypothetical protein